MHTTASPPAEQHATSRRLLASPWPAFGAVLLLAWVLLLVQHSSGRHDHASFATTLTMWMLMTVAMMAPTAVPVLISLRDITANSNGRVFWAFLGGYLAVWFGFAIVAAAAQAWLMRHDVVGTDGSSHTRWFTAGLLLLAGGYQFTALKQRCASECVHPMTFFWKHWRDGVGGGMRMGLRHGVTCLGCCWALMLLAFVGGITSIWFMVLSAAVMALEKLPSVGARVTLPLGVALVLAGGVVAFGPDPQQQHHAAFNQLSSLQSPHRSSTQAFELTKGTL